MDFIATLIISLFYIIIITNGVIVCINSIDCSEWTIPPFENTEASEAAVIEGDVEEITSPDIMNDAVSGLVNMGYKKTQARKSVINTVGDKLYTDPLQIIKEVLKK